MLPKALLILSRPQPISQLIQTLVFMIPFIPTRELTLLGDLLSPTQQYRGKEIICHVSRVLAIPRQGVGSKGITTPEPIRLPQGVPITPDHLRRAGLS